MDVPEEYNIPNKICKLKRSLCGLKQAPLEWNRKFTEFLKKNDLIRTLSEECVFRNTNNSLILAIHVGDGILFGEEESKIKCFLENLKTQFEVTVYDQPDLYL